MAGVRGVFDGVGAVQRREIGIWASDTREGKDRRVAVAAAVWFVAWWATAEPSAAADALVTAVKAILGGGGATREDRLAEPFLERIRKAATLLRR